MCLKLTSFRHLVLLGALIGCPPPLLLLPHTQLMLACPGTGTSGVFGVINDDDDDDDTLPVFTAREHG